ncbi:MAG: monofunctional biosynthetic peptidoglycan transglycosylase [Hyphomicrobiaceae bacterium]|nr:monofunctional biosynthetic peptidoglycan transglycosylase [Hyphomicrobiaceae bacterium]
MRFAWSAWLTSSYFAGLVLFAPLTLAIVALSAFFLIFSVVNPPKSSLMLWRQLGGETIDQTWVPLERMSPHLVRAVISSEDARFCLHGGIDWRELDLAMARSRRRGGDLSKIRGASTISMQVTKNLLLWPGRDFVRKGLELAITPLMEVIWSKRRVLEVYLNIAEWGPGVFGAEAAAQVHFGKSANALTAREASLLAAALPNPIEREAGRPGRVTRRHAQRIRRRMPSAKAYAGCVLGK